MESAFEPQTDATDLVASGPVQPTFGATRRDSTSLFDRLPFVAMPILWGGMGLYAGLKVLLSSTVPPVLMLVGVVCLLQSAAAIQLVILFVQRRWRWPHFMVWAVGVSFTLLAFAATVEPVPEGPVNTAFFWIGGIPVVVGGAAWTLRRSQTRESALAAQADADRESLDGSGPGAV
jgi:hypothetical protein